jgi:hypothetical protein
MIAMRGALALAAAGGLTACTHTSIPDDTSDPCDAAAGTCVLLHINGLNVPAIDQLQLEITFGEFHSTTTTGTLGTQVPLPTVTTLMIDLPSPPTFDVSLIAIGKLNGLVVGEDYTSTTVFMGEHTSVFLDLQQILPCTEGALYCGSINGLHVDFKALYRCVGGIPSYYASCPNSCYSPSSTGATCLGSGALCRDNGTYCGGNQVNGDPNTLYVCHSFQGTDPMPCPRGCQIRGDGQDACK